jgi:DNA-binding CsgD family transcriptional regulator
MNNAQGSTPFISAIDAFALRYRLSSREREILRLVADGVHPKAVGDLIGCGYNSVRTHLHRTYKKVGCSGTRELLARVLSATSW